MSFNPQDFLPEDFLPVDFLPEAGGGVDFEFVGPTIEDLVLVIDREIVARDFSQLFTSPLPLTFSVVGVLPTGLSLSSAGVLTGTPTVLGTTASLEIRADDSSTTVDSNSFSITIEAAPIGNQGVVGDEIGFSSIVLGISVVGPLGVSTTE